MELFFVGTQVFWAIVVLFLFKKMSHMKFVAYSHQLTGLPNERGLMAILKPLFGRFERGDFHSIVVAVIDVDDFKKINSMIGYRLADVVLKKIAEVLVSTVRAEDVVAHIHGDEFVVVFFDTTEKDAKNILLRAGKSLMKSELGFSFTKKIEPKFSFGLASSHSEKDVSYQGLFDRANISLEENKRLNKFIRSAKGLKF